MLIAPEERVEQNLRFNCFFFTIDVGWHVISRFMHL